MGHFPWLCQITRGYHNREVSGSKGDHAIAAQYLFQCHRSADMPRTIFFELFFELSLTQNHKILAISVGKNKVWAPETAHSNKTHRCSLSDDIFVDCFILVVHPTARKWVITYNPNYFSGLTRSLSHVNHWGYNPRPRAVGSSPPSRSLLLDA